MSSTKVNFFTERQIKESVLRDQILQRKEIPKTDEPIIVLNRVEGLELGLVEQTKRFVVRENFVLIKDGGLFIDIPEILFDQSFFEQIIVGSPAGQFGEYDSIGGKNETQMNEFAKKEGFYFEFDLTQVHSLLIGGWNGVYPYTLNKQSIPYFFPLKSKKGLIMFRVMVYKEGFLLAIEEPADTLWYRAKYFARYQKLHDPLEFLRRI